jgi:outer membrane protein assembly factor BamB
LAIDAQTGAEVWRDRLVGTYSASPVYADGRAYFFNRDSVATVIQPGREFQLVAVNHLDGEQMMASPAVAGKALFVRSESHLYRIEQR